MKASLVRISGLLAGIVLLLAPCGASAGDFTESMVVRWTFNKRGDAGLEDDQRGYRFTSRALPGFDEAGDPRDGVITLEQGQWLYCTAINSDAFANLAKRGLTLWVRLRLDGPGDSHTAFPFGLLNSIVPGDWNDATLVSLRKNTVEGSETQSLSFYGTVRADRTPFGAGDRTIEVKPGDFHEVAVVYDPRRETISLYVDGSSVEVRKTGMEPLGIFSCLALGQLKAAGYVSMTVDEIRLFSIPLDGDWLGDVSPVTSD